MKKQSYNCDRTSNRRNQYHPSCDYPLINDTTMNHQLPLAERSSYYYQNLNQNEETFT